MFADLYADVCVAVKQLCNSLGYFFEEKDVSECLSDVVLELAGREGRELGKLVSCDLSSGWARDCPAR